MNGRKNNPISFGITLVAPHRTKDTNTHPRKRSSAVRRQNARQGKIEQMSLEEFDCPRTKMPMPAKLFTPDMFNCEPRPLPAFPPPEKMSKEMERIHKELERSRSRTASHSFSSRTAWHPSSEKSSSMGLSIPWEFFKVVFSGVFLAFKYIFIAVAFIITISCMICAGRPTRIVKYRW